jgi:hypothetical protein
MQLSHAFELPAQTAPGAAGGWRAGHGVAGAMPVEHARNKHVLLARRPGNHKLQAALVGARERHLDQAALRHLHHVDVARSTDAIAQKDASWW